MKIYQFILATTLVSFDINTFETKFESPNCSCCLLHDVIANLYRTSPQTIHPLGGAVYFNQESIASEPIDTTEAENSGIVLFRKTGIYEIHWQLMGSALSFWSFGLAINDQVIPFSIGPSVPTNDQNTSFAQGTMICFIEAGQRLRLINTSHTEVELISSIERTSALMHIKLLSDLGF